MKLNFTKMQALGNDFVVIDDMAGRLKGLSRLSARLCDRKFGIGADQLLLLCGSKTADFKMRIFNADGSEVEMCGNGIRCLAKYVWERKVRSKKLKVKSLRIETIAGIMHIEKAGQLIRVDMGEPILEPEKIPVALRLTPHASRAIDYPLKIKDRLFKITCVSMGNPHAVIFVKDVNSFPVADYGPIIETHKVFPKKTNVEFIQVLNRKNIKMRVWERGAGETMACGTGASASAAASMLKVLADKKVTVHLSGGKLIIEWAVNNHIYMTGPAETVFEGTIDI
ncbi:MAG: diaminopimelate epimerase [Nitrospirae bacterium]|nr:diaminopimelate epimerase [Nitrospirota bacterium]